jgi:hypothetical protein
MSQLSQHSDGPVDAQQFSSSEDSPTIGRTQLIYHPQGLNSSSNSSISSQSPLSESGSYRYVTQRPNPCHVPYPPVHLLTAGFLESDPSTRLLLVLCTQAPVLRRLLRVPLQPELLSTNLSKIQCHARRSPFPTISQSRTSLDLPRSVWTISWLRRGVFTRTTRNHCRIRLPAPASTPGT